jgi:hypothetical protein
MPLWLRETRYDLERLRSDCNANIGRPVPGLSQQPFSGSADVVRQNWDEVLGHFSLIENDLHRRIIEKTDEIRGVYAMEYVRTTLIWRRLAKLTVRSSSTPAAFWKPTGRRR